MKKLILFTALISGSFLLSQEKTNSQKVFDLSDQLKSANSKKERDSIISQMVDLTKSIESRAEKTLAIKLIVASRQLAELQDVFIPAKDLNTLNQDDIKKFEIEKDKFAGTVTIRPDFLYIDPTIRIKLVWTNNTMVLFLISSYEGRDWLFMNKAILLIDGQKFEYNMSGKDRNVLIGRVSEYSVDPVSENEMNIVRAIANSKDQIEVRFSGSQGNKDFKLPIKTKERFAGMLNIFEKLKK